MRPVTVSQTGTGRSAIVVPDYLQVPPNVGISTTVSGGVIYYIQQTFDDVYAPTFSSATANWYTLVELIGTSTFSAATTSGFAFYDQPCRGYSINVTSGAGTVVMTCIQGTSP